LFIWWIALLVVGGTSAANQPQRFTSRDDASVDRAVLRAPRKAPGRASRTRPRCPNGWMHPHMR
jgi:hypothetical protein